jgi:outer membrane protein
MTTALVLAAALFAAPASAQPAPPLTLGQCYAWAKELSEALKSRAEDIRQAQSRARAALGGAFPHLDWDFYYSWQDPGGVNELTAQGFGGFVQKEQAESRFALTQPLFHGLRDLHAYKGFGHEASRDRLQLERAGSELFGRTADSFYTVLSFESDRANTLAGIELAQDRVKELQGFRRLGKARASEVYTAQAHAAALEAQLRQDEARITSAREDLSFLTGRDLSSATLTDEMPGMPAVPGLDDALAQAFKRSDLRAQREDLAGRRSRVNYERGSYWPGVDLTGDYYTRRVAYLNPVSWDVRLDLRVPIYQGGAVKANVDAAKSALRQSELLLQEMERRVGHDVRLTRSGLASAVEEARAQEAAADAAQKSYDTLREEYKLGLVTNLDVLQALDLLQAQKSARDAARLKAKRLSLDLAVVVEKIPL